MKKFLVCIIFFLASHLNSRPDEIIEYIKKNKLKEIYNICQLNEHKKSEFIDKDEILQALKESLQAREHRLSWKASARFIELVSGAIIFTYGLAKLMAEGIRFEDNHQCNEIANTFNIMQDLTSMASGIFFFKKAWENRQAKIEFEKTQVIVALVKKMYDLQESSEIKNV